MNVFLHAADLHGRAIQMAENACQIGLQFGSPRIREDRPAPLGAENDVQEDVGEGLRHGIPFLRPFRAGQ